MIYFVKIRFSNNCQEANTKKGETDIHPDGLFLVISNKNHGTYEGRWGYVSQTLPVR
jgi:hypothetical protein